MSEEQKQDSNKAPNPPVLRNKDDVALWPTKDGDKALLSGHVTVEGQKIQVRGFVNDTDKDGNKLAHPYLSLTTNTAGKDDPAQWKNLAYGNAMNTRSDGKQVFFDQVIFNLAGSDKTFNAYTGKGCTDELHAQLGFTSPRVDRPAREAADTPEAEAEEASAPSP